MEMAKRLAVLIDADNAQPAEQLTGSGNNKVISFRDNRSNPYPLNNIRAPRKLVFSHDSCVSSVLESSCMSYTLRFCARCFLALTKKSLFLEMPFSF